jgi:FdhD protein
MDPNSRRSGRSTPNHPVPSSEVDHRRIKGIATRGVRVLGQEGELGPSTLDDVVVEEPLEIRVAGDALAITMRTPGHDEDLALGFLLAEGIVSSASDVGRIAHCGRPGDEGYGNTIDVLPGAGAILDPDRLQSSRRGTLITAACGVCGRRSIDDLLERLEAFEVGDPDTGGVSVDLLRRCTEDLRSNQANFDRTGGVHAASLLDREGRMLAVAEDVGRHNAVDKVVGALLRQERLGEAVVLVVSGRVSFEIVQKAAVARVPIVAAVSAPTSLAVDLAERLGLTLCGFVRRGGLNIYSHPGRLAGVE